MTKLLLAAGLGLSLSWIPSDEDPPGLVGGYRVILLTNDQVAAQIITPPEQTNQVIEGLEYGQAYRAVIQPLSVNGKPGEPFIGPTIQVAPPTVAPPSSVHWLNLTGSVLVTDSLLTNFPYLGFTFAVPVLTNEARTYSTTIDLGDPSEPDPAPPPLPPSD